MGSLKTELQEALAAMGIAAEPEQTGLLEAYLEEIELWNPRYRLVAATGKDLLIRHVLDSLGALPAIAGLHPRRLADAGSGAGFPGIPLAVFLEDTEVVLIESSRRRAGFLQNVVVNLGLKKVRVVDVPVQESLERDFDVVVFRAFSPLNGKLLKQLRPLLGPSGTLAAYKGRRDRLEAELEGTASRLSWFEVLPLSIPGLQEERHLLLMRF